MVADLNGSRAYRYGHWSRTSSFWYDDDHQSRPATMPSAATWPSLRDCSRTNSFNIAHTPVPGFRQMCRTTRLQGRVSCNRRTNVSLTYMNPPVRTIGSHARERPPSYSPPQPARTHYAAHANPRYA